ncbi:MAG: hypothetical protein GEU93_10450 [Propionibacteriales bacterium]|nr:hypothetical protein [Propionibacteriales bacterium]
MSPLTILRLGFPAMWLVVFSYTAWEARSFQSNSGVFPFWISVGGIVVAAVTLVADTRALRKRTLTMGGSSAKLARETGEDGGEAAGAALAFRRSARYGGWLVGHAVMIWLIGAVAASALFVALFLLVEARAGWKLVVAGPVLVAAGLMTLASAINLFWPPALLPIIG